MIYVPQPWYLIPSYADVLGTDGLPVNAARHGYPLDLTTTAVRCVYTEDELQARALGVLVNTFGRVSLVQ